MNVIKQEMNNYLNYSVIGMWLTYFGAQIDEKTNGNTNVNAVWWAAILIMFCTWAFGASICWAHGGFVTDLGWFSVRCRR